MVGVGVGVGEVELAVLFVFEQALLNASRQMSAIRTHGKRKDLKFIVYFHLARDRAALSKELPERFDLSLP